jgi:PKD repeat protein
MDSVTHVVTIVNNTVSAPTFNFSPNNGCANVPVNFTNTSGGGLSYSWDFGDPSSGGQNTSTQSNPSHSFTATGPGGSTVYTVTLTGSNSSGCSNATTNTVSVGNKPDATLLDSNIFQPFSNCGNPNLTPATPGYHIAIQNGSTTQATNANYSINWGDGSAVFSSATFTQESHDYNALGIYTITLTVTGMNGCVATKTYQVFNLTNPSVGLNSPGNTLGCAPITLTFPVTLDSANLNFTTYTFDFDDGSPTVTWTPPAVFTSITHTFNTPSCGRVGNQFTVKVTAKNACDSTTATVNNIKVSSKPTANFSASPNPGCVGIPVSFTNSTTQGCNATNGSTITSYVWNFGDGTPATSPSTSPVAQAHTYTATGTYNVTLTATSSCGPSTMTIPVKILGPPVAAFTITPPACAPVTINTTNQSTGDSLTYNWNAVPGGWSFTGGTDADDLQPKFLFSTAGTYTITLTTTNPCGVRIKDTVVIIKSIPTVTLSAIPGGCQPYAVTPSATYTTGGGTISTYAWTFTGGTPTTATTSVAPGIAYNAAGTYTVNITATNECGPATASQNFSVSPQPTANAGTNTSVCGGSPASIGSASLPGLSYSWSSIPAGFSSSVSDPSVSPSATTSYVVSVSNGLCAKTDTVIVSVSPLPVVNAGAPQTFCINGAAATLTGTPSGGTWSGTGVSAAGLFTPSVAGVGAQTLTYSYTDGATTCSNSSTVNITVSALPVVNAGTDIIACNQPGTISLTGFSPAGGVWSGTGVTAAGVFTPSTAGFGIHELIYTYADANGCANKDTLLADVQNPSTANAGNNDTICLNNGVLNLVGFSPAGGTWSGTGISGNTFDPSVAGVGTVTLTYTFGVGTCATNDTRNVVVKPLPVVNAGNNQSVCIDAAAFNLTGFSPAGGTWSGPGITSAALGTFNPATAGAGAHALTYSYTDPVTNCTNAAVKTITVNALPLVNAGTGTLYCNQPAVIILSGYSPVGGTWSGNGIVSAAAGTFDPSTAPLGNDTLRYTFTDANGCTNNDTIINTIIAPSVANAGTNDTVCVDAAAFALSGFTPAGGTWTGTGVSAAGLFTPSAAGAGTYTLTYTFGVGTCQTSDAKVIVVNALPVVNAGPGNITCLNAPPFNLNGFSPAGGVWSGTGITGASAGTFDPAVSGTGTFTLTYTFTDAVTHCINSATTTVTINPLPAVDAGTGYTVCNQPITVTLTGFTPAGGTWSGTGVSAAGVFNPATAGVGTEILTYTFTSGIGCFNTDTIRMTVIAPVIANAGPNDTICLNNGLLLLSGFTPPAGTWTGTGITAASGTFDPLVSGAGNFPIVYSFGTGTCLTTSTKNVIVKSLPVMTAGPDQTTCISSNAFTVSGFSPAGGSWNGTGINAAGVFNPSVAGVGVHTLTYTYTDPVTNCTDTRTKTVEVGALPVVAFNVPAVNCINLSTVFTNTTTGANDYQWFFGDGGTSSLQSPSHIYTTTGFYTVELIATSPLGCTDSAFQSTQLIAPPLAVFTTTPDSGCAPLNVIFTNSSSGDYISFAWDLGNGVSATDTIAPAQIYQQGLYDTTYYISLTVSNQCASVGYFDSVIVKPVPVVDFGTNVSEGCSPLPILFNNISTGNADVYTWNFGDGTANSNTLNPPTHIYFTGTNDTTFTITLAGVNECGSDTMRRNILVHPNTVNAFFNTSSTAGCAPHTVAYTNFASGGNFVTWDFGDGNTSTQASPIHTYLNAGIYTCYQYVNNGCSYDTFSVVITVHPPPGLSFNSTPATTCANQAITFNNTSVNAVNFDWFFGDGDSSNLVSPSHSFGSPGSYTVTLIGTSTTFGCRDTVTSTVNINSLPVPVFAPNIDFGCMPLPVNFSNNSTNAAFYTWNFGDGNTATAATPSHTYTNQGMYTITLVVENLNGCRDSITHQVNVYPKPVADFALSATYACTFPANVSLTNNSTGATGYQWDLGNGQTPVTNNAVATYTANGLYTISLIANNTYGCKDTALNTFNVYPTPVVNFTPSGILGCEEYAVTFSNETQDGISYVWLFTDGTTSTDSTPTHIFQDSGVYGITLIATSYATCSDTLVRPNLITVNPSPQSDFSYNQLYSEGIPNGTIQFLNASVGALAYTWNFGDGAGTNAETHPEHQFPGVDTYNVTLISENQYHCTDTIVKPVKVDYFQGLFVPNAFIPGSAYEDLRYFIPKGKTLKTYRLQIFNTWGTLLFESDKLDGSGAPVDGWDGTFQGEPCAQDVYVWKVEAIFRNDSIWLGKEYTDKEVKNTGTVTLLR